MKNKITITIVQGAFLPVPPIRGGAIEKRWFTMGQEFARLGHHVLHISKRDSDLKQNENIAGVEHIRISSFKGPRNPILYKLFDFLYSLRALFQIPKSDIIITNTFFLPILLSFVKRGAVYVDFARYPKRQAKLYSKVSRIRAPSNAVLEGIIEQTPSVKHLTKYIPNFLPQAFADLKIIPEAKRQKKIVYVGRIHPEKGVSILIKAANRLKLNLDIIGPHSAESGSGGDLYISELKSLAEENISFKGPIYDDQLLIEYLSNAYAFIYPSLAAKGEAFPVAPLEAMACAAIPIVSSLECFKDLIEDGKQGLYFDHHSDVAVDSLCEKISTLFSMDEKSVIELRKNCLQQADQFSSEKVAQLFLEDFQGIMTR